MTLVSATVAGAAAAALSAAGVPYYAQFAARRGIVAHMNSRTLHDQIVPRGAGVVFSVVFVAAISALCLAGLVPTPVALALSIGGTGATALGFVDDVRGLKPGTKLLAHVMLSVLSFAVLYDWAYAPALRTLTPIWFVVAAAAFLFVPVWMINVFNFVDGVDGLAASGAVIMSATAAIVLIVTGDAYAMAGLFVLLGAATAGFLFHNAPPARVFMGDAGSIFLGYTTASLALATISTAQISPWTWVIMLAYFIGDTTTTTLFRIVLVKQWYGVHRSHAYQNLARIGGSHGRVTYGIAAYQLLVAAPLAIASALRPNLGPMMAAAALLPPIVWTCIFGPRLSSD